MSSGWWPQSRQGDLVAYLDDGEYARLLGHAETADAAAGDFLLHKGSPSRSLLLVEAGEIEIVDESLGEAVVMGRVGPGGVVGEVGFVDGRPRTHNVRARTDCRVRRLTREGLLALAQSDPLLVAKVAMALAELVARRFRSALAELDPVRAFAASLGEPDDTLAEGPLTEEDVVREVSRARGNGDDDGDGAAKTETFDAIDDPQLEQALGMLRELARRPTKDLAGV